MVCTWSSFLDSFSSILPFDIFNVPWSCKIMYIYSHIYIYAHVTWYMCFVLLTHRPLGFVKILGYFSQKPMAGTWSSIPQFSPKKWICIDQKTDTMYNTNKKDTNGCLVATWGDWPSHYSLQHDYPIPWVLEPAPRPTISMKDSQGLSGRGTGPNLHKQRWNPSHSPHQTYHLLVRRHCWTPWKAPKLLEKPW